VHAEPIKSDRDYRRALKEVEILMSASRGSRDGKRLNVPATLVEAWERKHYPLRKSSKPA
jgi:HTH-type transcriptional regulator/antitoxin HigA